MRKLQDNENDELFHSEEINKSELIISESESENESEDKTTSDDKKAEMMQEQVKQDFLESLVDSEHLDLSNEQFNQLTYSQGFGHFLLSLREPVFFLILVVVQKVKRLDQNCSNQIGILADMKDIYRFGRSQLKPFDPTESTKEDTSEKFVDYQGWGRT